MISVVLAATLTFTATATGVEKGTSVEFLFAGKGSDRDYETMFLLDETVDSLCDRLESAGLPRGKPADMTKCRFWPVGCRVTFSPSLDKFVSGKMPEGLPAAVPIYTGGSRLADGRCDASTNMPLSVFSTFSLNQSPFVYNGIFNQGAVYGAFSAGVSLKKGTRVEFSVSWDEKQMPRSVHMTARPGCSRELLSQLRHLSGKGELDVTVGFDDRMTVQESTALARALSEIDSPQVKINGCSNLFYRSFLPLVKWRDRSERLVQPFELSIGNPDALLFIEEDWTVEGTDPRLTPKAIPLDSADAHPRTDTCFIYASSTTTVSRIMQAIGSLKTKRTLNYYVFGMDRH